MRINHVHPIHSENCLISHALGKKFGVGIDR